MFMKTLLLVLGLAFAGPTFAAQLNSPHFTSPWMAAAPARPRADASASKPPSANRGPARSPVSECSAIQTGASRCAAASTGRDIHCASGFKDGLVVVSWETGVGDNTKPVSAVLEYTNELHTDPAANIWTPLALAPEARSASFPIASAPRFFRLREK